MNSNESVNTYAPARSWGSSFPEFIPAAVMPAAVMPTAALPAAALPAAALQAAALPAAVMPAAALPANRIVSQSLAKGLFIDIMIQCI